MLANPNINCLIVCGKESEHLVGESIISLAENRASTMTGLRKIIGSNFPLHCLNETQMTAISHFLWKIKVIGLVGNKDPVTIQKAINSFTTPARSEAYVTSILDRFLSSRYCPIYNTLKISTYY